jgi:uncharacterized protein
VILLDANVLVYASNERAPQHADSRAVVEHALDGRLDAALLPQVLLEFHAVVTHARRFEHPIDPDEAWRQIQALTARIPLLEVPASAFDEMPGLIQRHQPAGGDVFDVFLVAQMRAHGIATICTEDLAGFERFAPEGIQALQPSAVSAG